jgi:predicted NBD/HSP70 family sugar kinase
MVGTAALLQRAREQLVGVEPLPEWAREELTVQSLIAAAHAGDATARMLITGAGQALGVAMANLLNLVNPGRIVLGGHLTEAGAMLLDPLRTALSERALWSSVEGSELVISPLGDQAVALGAATLLLQAALEDPQRLLPPQPRPAAPLVPFVNAGHPAPTFERSI